MTENRSSTWSMVERHCLYALTMYEAHGPGVMPPAVQVGASSHALLQAVGEEVNKIGRPLESGEIEALADEVAARLIARGRSFEGEPEDPLPPLAVQEGMEIAERWLLGHPIYPGGQCERGLAVDRQWQPTEYGHAAWYRAILDRIEETEIELMDGLLIRDYKGYWSAGETELRGVQLRGQAVLAHRHGMTAGKDVLRLEVANLRTGGAATIDLDLYGGDGIATLERWQRQLERSAQEIEAARDAAGKLPASPGPGCMGCPYLGTCEHAGRYLSATDIPADPGERARLWCVLAAKLAQVRELVELDADGAAVPIADSDQRLGWRATESIELAPGGEFVIADLWRKHSSGADNLEGLLMAAKLGAGNLNAIARQIAPRDTAAQLALIEPAVKMKTGRSWEVSDVPK